MVRASIAFMALTCSVRPGSLDELRQVLKIANQHGIPLWTFSRGKNLGYVSMTFPRQV